MTWSLLRGRPTYEESLRTRKHRFSTGMSNRHCDSGTYCTHIHQRGGLFHARLFLLNLFEALILESAGHDSASSLGVALFALTSALSRIGAGVLSDKYKAYFNRFHWLSVALLDRR